MKMISDDLAKLGYAIVPNFISQNDLFSIVEEVNSLQASSLFKSAGVGRSTEYQKDDQVRRDFIHWFDREAETAVQKLITEPFELLRQECNQSLYLGLETFEGHYAIYEKGAFYKRHIDCFRNDDSRVLSAILYLNLHWKKGDGGELILYTPEPLRVEPIGGTLVCFLSRDIEHEVLESAARRLSFASWFRKRPVTLNV